MKMTTGILGCALVAGLMTFAPSQSQAGNVDANGNLYAPLNLKLVINQYNSNGKIVKKTVTSKQVLKDLGYNSDVVLAVIATDYYGYYGDVVVINKKSGAIIEDLTYDGAMGLDAQQYLSQSKSGSNGSGSYESTGTVAVWLDTMNSNNWNYDDYFSISGAYSAKANYGKFDKNGDQTIKVNGKANSLSGTGYFEQANVGTTVVTGSASINGSGKGSWNY
ncbi:MAG: hypothetical protein WCS42_17120 [Verrucomicrobiota bacterium]